MLPKGSPYSYRLYPKGETITGAVVAPLLNKSSKDSLSLLTKEI